MTFVVRERIGGAWVARGESPSLKNAEAIAKAIREERLARGDRPNLIDKTLQVRNELKLSPGLPGPITASEARRKVETHSTTIKDVLGFLQVFACLLSALFLIALVLPASCTISTSHDDMEWARKP